MGQNVACLRGFELRLTIRPTPITLGTADRISPYRQSRDEDVDDEEWIQDTPGRGPEE
jgi:hypothetical protein